MKTAKEWIENPRYWNQDFHKKIKKELLKRQYDDSLLSWNQFEKLTNFNSII